MIWRIQIHLFLCLLIITWSVQTEMDDDVPTSTTPKVEQEHVLASDINEFGYKLMMKMMKQNENKNIIISPTGVAGLLAMSLLGTVGRTYDELADTLGFSQDILANRNNHEQFGELLQVLNANDTSSRTMYADAIFVDAQTQLREIYRSYLKRVYNGEVLAANFSDCVKVKNTINEWVKTQTNGKIEEFLKQELPVDTKVVLLSALYFSGQWAQPFIPEYTLKMPFKKSSGEVMADLMLNLGDFDYIFSVDDGLHMIAFPYNDSITTMYALKPRLPKRLSLPDLMERLDYAKIDNLINQMSKKKSVIRFPKMELKSNANLETALKALGLKSMFSPGEANFALMVAGNTVMNKTEEELITRINSGKEEASDLKDVVNRLANPGVYVDSVIHDVRITINEYGTEAVAATSGILARSAEQFYADSPFYMFIRNERTKLVTFSAIIFDPTV